MGWDPITERDAKKAARAASAATVITFEQCAKAYITSYEAGWRNPKHRQQWRNTLDTYVYPVFGAVPIGEVDTVRVLEALTPIWYEKTETANRIRGRIETILDFATVKGLRQGENPAQWRGRLAHALPSKGKITKVKHHPALSARETPGFIAALKTPAAMAPLCLQFAVLTAARIGMANAALLNSVPTSGTTDSEAANA
jgi:integrase